jgi:radical SAM superfamily enzyme YgiQ (UPF0313 family)
MKSKRFKNIDDTKIIGNDPDYVAISERLRDVAMFSPEEFRMLAKHYAGSNCLWKILDIYRNLINSGLEGRNRYEAEKVLREEFPFLRTKDFQALVKKYDLVLVQAPAWGVNTPPFAIASLAAFMRREGFRVLVQDLNITLFYKRGERFLRSWDLAESLVFWNSREDVLQFARFHERYLQKWTDYIIGSGARVIGFSIYGSSYYMSLYLAELIKMRDNSIIIVFGGPHMSKFLAGRTAAKHPCVDVVVDGEGELTLKDIVERIKTGSDLYGCEGTLQKAQEGIAEFGGRELIRDISTLPFADFSDYDLKLYMKPFTLPIMSSRGCPNRCIYCNEKAFWKRFRPRSAESIFNEMKHQIRLYPHIRVFEFHDSVVNGNIRELEKLCDLIIENNLNIRWTGQAIIRKEMDYRLLSKLARAGCTCLAYGLETVSTDLMKRIGKVLSKDTDIDRILKDGKKAGVPCSVNFMFGLPGETEEDFMEVLRFVRDNKDYISTVNPSPGFCGFAPGTPGYEEPEKYGIDFKYGPTFWESKDGKNNYELRLKRFETFCRLVYELGIDTTYPHTRLLNRDEKLKEYFLVRGERKKALPHLFNILASGRGNESDRTVFFECWNEAPLSLREIQFDVNSDNTAIVRKVRERIERLIDDAMEKDDLNRARLVLNEALEVDKTRVEYYLLLAEIYLKTSEYEEAVKILDILLQERPDYMKGREYKKAIERYMRKAVAV